MKTGSVEDRRLAGDRAAKKPSWPSIFIEYQSSRAGGLLGQIAALEAANRIAIRLVRRNRITRDQYLYMRDALQTLRMIVRICVSGEFASDAEVYGYLLAELAEEDRLHGFEDWFIKETGSARFLRTREEIMQARGKYEAMDISHG